VIIRAQKFVALLLDFRNSLVFIVRTLFCILNSMKITTRIISGYVLFIAILAGLLAGQAITAGRMLSIIRTLSGSGFQQELACLQALRDGDLVEENISKLLAAGADPEILKKLQESQETFETSLKGIRTYAQSGKDLAEANRLSQLWIAYLADQEALLQHLPKNGTVLPQSLQNDLEQLRAQTLSVYQAGLHSASSKAEESRRTGETAVLALYCAALVSLATCILVSFFIYRSISKPLAQLMEGVRSMAEGRHYFRLDTSRTDELSLLARDINKITDRLDIHPAEEHVRKAID
jgi:methyl-accepting chemotaxis protein